MVRDDSLPRDSGPGQPPPVYQLVYVSTATQPMSARANEELADAAKARNTELAVTGVLLYSNSHYLQFLEGSRHNVGGLFEVIRNDSRHHDVYVLRRQFIPQRQFSDWRMRLIEPHDVADEQSAMYSRLFGIDSEDPDVRRFAIETWTILNSFPSGEVSTT